jgi:hypothetical protein
LSEHNVELEDRIEEMKKKMKEGQLEIERTTDEYLKLKVMIENTIYFFSLSEGCRGGWRWGVDLNPLQKFRYHS